MVDKGKAFSTIKMYLAAISACHIRFEGKAAGQHPFVCSFIRGACHRLPVSKPLTQSCELPTVLDAFFAPAFKPLEQVELKMVTLKTALLLALASAKKVGDSCSFHYTNRAYGSGNARVSL